MTTISEKLSQRSSTNSITNGFMHIILPSGAIYQSFKISTDDRIIAENGKRTYKRVFTDSDLAAGILNTTHWLNTEDVQLVLKSPDNKYLDVSGIATIIDDNNVSIDFSGSIDAGNWVLLIISWKQ